MKNKTKIIYKYFTFGIMAIAVSMYASVLSIAHSKIARRVFINSFRKPLIPVRELNILNLPFKTR